RSSPRSPGSARWDDPTDHGGRSADRGALLEREWRLPPARAFTLADLGHPLHPREAPVARRHQAYREAVARRERLILHVRREQQIPGAAEREAPLVPGGAADDEAAHLAAPCDERDHGRDAHATPVLHRVPPPGAV